MLSNNDEYSGLQVTTNYTLESLESLLVISNLTKHTGMYWCQVTGYESFRLNLNDEDYYTSQDAVTCSLQTYTESSDRCIIDQTDHKYTYGDAY